MPQPVKPDKDKDKDKEPPGQEKKNDPPTPSSPSTPAPPVPNPPPAGSVVPATAHTLTVNDPPPEMLHPKTRDVLRLEQKMTKGGKWMPNPCSDYTPETIGMENTDSEQYGYNEA